MHRMRRRPKAASASLIVCLTLVLGVPACTNYAAPFQTVPPMPGTPTRMNSSLRSLPRPQEPIVAAVYRFRDQSGQYKPSDASASWSTAVTQGATSILMAALEESGWFVPLEREGLSNLLNERQIISSIRAQYDGPEGERLGPLPPLLYAGIILEGGIIGYDTNLVTGGLGARYFGAGGSAQFRQDQVTVYLRAVATQTGRVLQTVHTTKTILSQRMDAGIFRFIQTDRLIETEVGYSFNEPPVVAVTEAIEEAVRSLVIEGIRSGLWNLGDSADMQHPAIKDYDRARSLATSHDHYGLRNNRDRGGAAFMLNAGARRLQGNYRDPLTRPSLELGAHWMTSPRLGLGISGAIGDVGARDAFSWTAGSVEAHGIYYVLPFGNVSPFLRGGLGLMKPDLSSGHEWGDHLFPFATMGGGVEYLLTPLLGLNVTLLNRYALLDGLDGVKEGKGRDSVWNLGVGLAIYPGGR
jgi:curli production assembly/transport component CsgG